jgi:hypothetical protein
MASHGSSFRMLLCAAVLAVTQAVARAQSGAPASAAAASAPDNADVRTDEAAAGSAEASEAMETKNIFGFTSGTDIGPPHDRELELQTDLQFGKRRGTYHFGDQLATVEYNPTAWLEVDLGVHANFNQIRGVDGLDNRSAVNFGGAETKLTFVLVRRSPAAPVGLSVSVEPEWSRIDDDGLRTRAFGAETRIIADTELVPATLYASLNAIFDPLVDREIGTQDWGRSTAYGFAGALAYRLDPAVAGSLKQAVLGAELEYFRAYDTLGLSRFTGDALFFGPTFYLHFNDTLFVAGALSTQIAGRSVGDPGPLNLDRFTRNKAQMTIGINF